MFRRVANDLTAVLTDDPELRPYLEGLSRREASSRNKQAVRLSPEIQALGERLTARAQALLQQRDPVSIFDLLVARGVYKPSSRVTSRLINKRIKDDARRDGFLRLIIPALETMSRSASHRVFKASPEDLKSLLDQATPRQIIDALDQAGLLTGERAAEIVADVARTPEEIARFVPVMRRQLGLTDSPETSGDFTVERLQQLRALTTPAQVMKAMHAVGEIDLGELVERVLLKQTKPSLRLPRNLPAVEALLDSVEAVAPIPEPEPEPEPEPIVDLGSVEVTPEDLEPEVLTARNFPEMVRLYRVLDPGQALEMKGDGQQLYGTVVSKSRRQVKLTMADGSEGLMAFVPGRREVNLTLPSGLVEVESLGLLSSLPGVAAPESSVDPAPSSDTGPWTMTRRESLALYEKAYRTIRVNEPLTITLQDGSVVNAQMVRAGRGAIGVKTSTGPARIVLDDETSQLLLKDRSARRPVRNIEKRDMRPLMKDLARLNPDDELTVRTGRGDVRGRIVHISPSGDLINLQVGRKTQELRYDASTRHMILSEPGGRSELVGDVRTSYIAPVPTDDGGTSTKNPKKMQKMLNEGGTFEMVVAKTSTRQRGPARFTEVVYASGRQGFSRSQYIEWDVEREGKSRGYSAIRLMRDSKEMHYFRSTKNRSGYRILSMTKVS